jgi:hypothetical protein
MSAEDTTGGGIAPGAVPPPCFDRPVLVCGNAACLHDDLATVAHLHAPVIAVNGAAAEVQALALYSKHTERMPRWIGQQQRFGKGFLVYAARADDIYSWVDYWVPEVWGGGGSAWDARKLATHIGYGPVILCGCPMVVGPYVGNHNLNGFMHREDIVAGFRDDIAKDLLWHAGCYSMSGWTRDLLGAYPDADGSLRPVAGL